MEDNENNPVEQAEQTTSIAQAAADLEASPEIIETRRKKIMDFFYKRMIAAGGGSIGFHVVVIILAIVLAVGTAVPNAPVIEVKMVTPEVVEVQKEPEIEKEIEPEVNPENINEELPISQDNVLTIGDPNITDTTAMGSGGSDKNMAGIGSGEGTEQGFEISVVHSPLKIKGLYAARTAGGRQGALTKYGGGRNAAASEAAVLRALRWLKKNQASEGSWPKVKPAMTALALLAFLAHGETPASAEFGLTVESGLKWMLENQEEGGRFKGRDANDYSHPIAAYALSEGYAMTMIPDLKYAAEKAIAIIVKGQHPNGGWDYKCAQTARDDTSYMGWCAQALKAAKMAGLDVEGLENACKKAIDGFKVNAQGDYDLCGFGYTSPGQGGLTAVGALCMQLLGAGGANEVAGSLKLMDTDKWQFKLVDPPIGKSGMYYFYYATQAKFHAGGETWNKWNKQFSPELVKGQIVIPAATSEYCDQSGKKCDIGYWDQYPGSGNDNNPVFSTLLCLLQLEVYYRYLPTFKGADAAVSAEVKKAPAAGGNKPVKEQKIDIQF